MDVDQGDREGHIHTHGKKRRSIRTPFRMQNTEEEEAWTEDRNTCLPQMERRGLPTLACT